MISAFLAIRIPYSSTRKNIFFFSCGYLTLRVKKSLKHELALIV